MSIQDLRKDLDKQIKEDAAKEREALGPEEKLKLDKTDFIEALKVYHKNEIVFKLPDLESALINRIKIRYNKRLRNEPLGSSTLRADVVFHLLYKSKGEKIVILITADIDKQSVNQRVFYNSNSSADTLVEGFDNKSYTMKELMKHNFIKEAEDILTSVLIRK